MDIIANLKFAALSLLDQFRVRKGRKPLSEIVPAKQLAPLIERLNLPELPSAVELFARGMTAEQFVTHVISPKYLKGVMGNRRVVSRRVVNKIVAYYGVAPIQGYLKPAACDPRFDKTRNRHSMLVVALA